MSTTYQPSTPSPSFTSEQRQWLKREFDAIKSAMERGKTHETYVVLHAEPARLVAGMEVYADGTDFDPDGLGSGAGLYRRNEANTAWVFVG